MKINDFVPNGKIFDSLKSLSSDNQEETGKTDSNSFISMLKDKLDEVNNNQIAADNATESFIKGDSTDIHQVMLQSEEAKLSLELAVQVRNKLVEAYQELNRMQL